MSPESISELRAAIQGVLPEIIALRHDLHRNPELSGQETRTSALIAQRLRDAGIACRTDVGGMHGVIADIDGGLGIGKTIALRGDMDALPIHEENDAIPYKSGVAGVMHACGHDGHTANLLGTALVLNGLKNTFAGRVRFLFQPAEETVSGAESVIRGGGMDNVDAVVMLHGWPDLPPGVVGVRNGPAMASSDTFALTVRGHGGHAAYPHKSVDPIYVGVQIVNALQSLVAREISPLSPAVVSVTMFHAGTARNIIADNAEISGTIRTLDPALRDTMFEKIERVAKGVCDALRASYSIEFKPGTPVVVNSESVSDLIRATAIETLGPDNLVELGEPTMGAEDFAYYLQKAPGAMFRLGTGCPSLLHTPKYDFGDAPLSSGILMLAGIVRNFLSAG